MESDPASGLFDQANDVLGFDLKRLCTTGTLDELTQTEFTQPAVFVTSVAFFEVYKNQLPAVHFMAGHSLGEYTALTCSGALGFRETLALVKKRSALMKKAAGQGNGTMLAVEGLPANALERICADLSRDGHIVSIAARNSARQFVISGHTAAVQATGDQCRGAGAVTTPLRVSAPFHSRLMATAACELTEELQKYKFKPPACPVLSNATGLQYRSEQDIVLGLARQMTEPIDWTGCLAYMTARDVQYFIEIGPGRTLRNLLKRDNRPDAFAVDKEKDLQELRHFISSHIGVVSTVVTRCLGISMTVRNANEDPEQYHHGVIRPYTRIREIQERLEKEKSLPGDEEIDEAITGFCRILNTKKLRYCDKLERLQELLTGTGVMDLFTRYVAHLT